MGSPVTSNNPALHTYADLSFTSTGGIYFVAITNSAAGSPYSNPPSGYTKYGSLGQYALTGYAPSLDLNVLTQMAASNGW